MRTPQQVVEAFAERGLSFAEWARTKGFNVAVVYQVLKGRRKCMRGQAHEIAVALGLKEGLVERDYSFLELKGEKR